MEGAAGLRAWRWLFIVEGAVTIAVAAVAVFILPDYPSSTRWLKSSQLSSRLRKHSGPIVLGCADSEPLAICVTWWEGAADHGQGLDMG